MKKYAIVLLCFGAVALQYCSSSRRTAQAPKKVSFQADILPVVETSCAPCHISGKGNKTPYNQYASAKGGIDEIIERINRNPGDRGFMPARHPKLADTTIRKFVRWKDDGFAE